MTYQTLSYLDVLGAASLLMVNALISIAMRLGLAKRLLVAGVRMVAQLALMGLVLKVLFQSVSPLYTILAALLMLAFAAREAMVRQDRKFTGGWSYALGAGSMTVAGTIVTLFALSGQLHADPWYDPRYAIPILGMVLGNTMNGVSIGLDRLISTCVRERGAIEARLALGEEARVALHGPMREAMRAGMIPTINGMSAVGLVSIPGMMTGQILAGVDPVEAVKYQLLIMFLIGGGTALGLCMAVFSGAWRLTDHRHRLRLDRLGGTSE